MDDLRTRAQLVGFDRAGAIGTVVTRAEIADAAAGGDFPATLLLDLEKVGAADGGEDLFVHHSAIVGEGYKTLAENAKVQYEPEQGQKGPQATNVTLASA